VDWTLSHEHAGAAIDAVALGLIGLALLGTIVRRLEVAIWLLGAQGLLLGVAAGAAALAEETWRPWVACALALAIKAVAVPLILSKILGRVALRHEAETVVPIKLAFPLAVGLIVVAYYAIEPFTRGTIGGFDAPNALPAALALQLLGLFTMVTRKKALTQLVGLVTMENGLFLAAVAATRGLPFVVELGVALDVLTAVAVMALVIHEINHLVGGINTDRLRALRD
jgi:hydrogenase-4 component E